jgi:hypothetical protein
MSYIGTEPKDIRSFGRTKFDYTATQGQTAFTGADDDGKVLAFTVGQIEVYVNGILMDDSDFTTTGTGTVTLASAANLNDVVNVVSFETNIPDSNYVPASGGTFTGAVTHSGTVTLSGNVSGATTFTDQVTFGTNTNLLSNAEFTTNTTGWAATGSTLAIVSNELQLTPGSGVNGFANQQVDNLVIGASYIASVTVTVDAGSLSRLYIGTSANGNQTVNTLNLGTGTHSFTFVATATTHHFALVVGGGNGQVTRFDNAKLIEANKVTFPAGYGKVDGILAVDRATSDGTIIDLQKDGTSVGTVGSYLGTYLYMGSAGGTDTHINFVNGNVRPATATGAHLDNSLDLGHSQSRWKDLYLSGGAYLGGTGAVNKLSDYEYGSWTPVLLATSTNPSHSSTGAGIGGAYVKIGNVVHVWFDINVNITNAGSGTAMIGGLPITPATSVASGGYSTVQFRASSALSVSSNVPITGWVYGSNNRIYPETNQQVSQSPINYNVGNSIRITGMSTYYTTA